MRIDAVILARGGSKGIPNKNIIDFCGKPLLAWTIEQCQQAKAIDNVWVSSDDDKILRVAKKYGAELINRPDEISGDYSTSESGWLHATNFLAGQGIQIDAMLAPQVTSPLRQTGDIDRAVEVFKTQQLDSLFSASIVDDLYYWESQEDGKINSVNYDYRNRQRRQDFKSQIIENGSFYLYTPEVLRSQNNRFGGKIGYSKMKFWQMFEIDDKDDIRMCSALMKEFILGIMK